MTYYKFTFVMISIFLTALIAGCGGGEAVEGAEQYVTTIGQIDIPEDAKIIGLGEATHGNVELQELKRDVFEALMTNDQVRVFVLEGDFGGGQQINRFIVEGIGTAKEAVYALDYGIYKTKQMIDLVQWMHNYNAAAGEDEKIYFYGNDMQRYDYSKQGLLDYYKAVNVEAAQTYSARLAHVSNDTMRELSTKQLEELDRTLDQIISDLQSNETVYIEQSSQESFAFALQFARVMKQRTQLFLHEGNYSQLRDQYLAENLQWIVEFEAARGHDKVLISGHNGHIEKTSASPAGYKSMGNYLDEQYGSAYFAIGTDLIKSEFQAQNHSAGERKIHTIKNHNELVDAFGKVESNIFYVGFEQARASKELSDILTKEQKMMNVGDDFQSWYKISKMFYTIKMIPDKAYDAVIIVKEATPTTVMD